jgi:hypothetical protein
MNDVKFLKNGGSVISDSYTVTIVNQFIHTAWTHRGLHDSSNGLTRRNIREDLRLTLTVLCSFFKKQDPGLLHFRSEFFVTRNEKGYPYYSQACHWWGMYRCYGFGTG